MHYIYLYATALVTFLLIDAFWLGVIATNLYRTYLGHLLAPTVFWPAAIAFYLLFIVGILVFAVLPAIELRSLTRALVLGALFGFLAYATYDLTNWATLRDWPAVVTIIDLAWGAFISAAVAGVTYWVGITYIVE